MTTTIFANANIFDGTGSDIFRADIEIADNRIKTIGHNLAGDNIIDCSNKTILPGFIDCHVHLTIDNSDVSKWISQPFSYQFFRAAENLTTTLKAGVTTVRDAMGADLGIKQALEDGLIQGPRLQISLNMISQTGGHNDTWNPSGICAGLSSTHPGMPSGVADGVEEVRKTARKMLRAGADVLKVSATGGVLSPTDHPEDSQFSLTELQVLVDEAKAANKPVMAHAQGTNGIKNAVRAGVKSIEHGIYLDDETITLMLEKDVWLVPTLMAPYTVLESASKGFFIAESQLEKAKSVIEAHKKSFQKAVAAGVNIAMGTDSGILGHGDNLRELQLMNESGMPAANVLKSATSSAAKLLGLEGKVGVLASGAYADMLILERGSNPYDFTNLATSIEQVWKDGKQVRRVKKL